MSRTSLNLYRSEYDSQSRELFPDRNLHRECVVLVHGLFATKRSMDQIERRTREAGYDVINWGYSSLFRNVSSHAKRLGDLLQQLQGDHAVRSIHLITHSLGGIVARYVLSEVPLRKVHRMVMLAPPNRGSHLTRVSLGPFRWLVPSIAELMESPDSLPNRLQSSCPVEIGVIAASRDFVVHVANTQLDEQLDHCVVPTSHFALPCHREAMEYTLNFIRHGSFTSPPQALRRLAA